MPRPCRVPVVPGDHGMVVAENVDNAGHIRGHLDHRVVLDCGRGGGAPVAAQVRGDGVIAGISQCGELAAPGVPQFGEAVQQQDQRAVSGLGQVDIDAVGVDGAVRDGGYGLAHCGASCPACGAGPGRAGAPRVPAMKLRWMTASLRVPPSLTMTKVARAASGTGRSW